MCSLCDIKKELQNTANQLTGFLCAEHGISVSEMNELGFSSVNSTNLSDGVLRTITILDPWDKVAACCRVKINIDAERKGNLEAVAVDLSIEISFGKDNELYDRFRVWNDLNEILEGEKVND